MCWRMSAPTWSRWIDCLLWTMAGGRSVAEVLCRSAPERVEVIENSENQGIAAPLNEVLRRCDGKFDLLLTMDQDSAFADGVMAAYRTGAEDLDWTDVFGLSPTPTARGAVNGVEPPLPLRWYPVPRCITSGNLISVAKARAVGGFDEALFIDEVDHDICYRATQKGWNHLRSPDVILWHRLGNTIEKWFIWRPIHAMGHSKIRKYYIARNRLVVWRRYHHMNEGFFFRRYLVDTAREVFNILYMETDKWKKLKFLLMGVRDAVWHQMGRLELS